MPRSKRDRPVDVRPAAMVKRYSPGPRRFDVARREAFLEELKLCRNVRFAAASAGTSKSSVYYWRDRDRGFAEQWDTALDRSTQLAPRRINPGGAGARPSYVRVREKFDEAAQRRFLVALAATSNVTAAAQAAGITANAAYQRRRRDPAFYRARGEALAHGYEALEMALLERARFGVPRPIFHAGSQVGEYRVYDNATGLRLLVAHRAMVAEARAAQAHADHEAIREQALAELNRIRTRLEQENARRRGEAE